MGKGLADSQKSNPGPRRLAPVFPDATRTLVLIDEGPGDSPNQEKVHSTEMSSMPMCFVPLTPRITEKRMRVNETSLAEVFQFPGSPEKRSRRSLRREPMMPRFGEMGILLVRQRDQQHPLSPEWASLGFRLTTFDLRRADWHLDEI